MRRRGCTPAPFVLVLENRNSPRWTTLLDPLSSEDKCGVPRVNIFARIAASAVCSVLLRTLRGRLTLLTAAPDVMLAVGVLRARIIRPVLVGIRQRVVRG